MLIFLFKIQQSTKLLGCNQCRLLYIKLGNMRFLLLLLIVCCTIDASAQMDTIKLSNPSFEDTPRKGGESYGIKGWFDCGIINFPKESPPDIHPKDYWANTKQASDGKTYLGMVTRDNDTWESVSQRLSQPMKAGQCYSFSIELSQSKRYISGSRLEKEENGNDAQTFNYTTPAVFRIWGGSGFCNTKELLGESVPIKHSEWKTYSFKFEPTFNHRFIVIEAIYKLPLLIPYNGHILLDNCSQIIQIDCDEEEIVEVKPEKVIPPHKRFKKVPKKQSKTDPKLDESAKTVTQAPTKKKVMNLDRSKMKKGQTIEIKNLYFKADVAFIDEESFDVLDEVFDFLKTNNDITMEIGGHTNGTPPHKYCDKLSEERAKEVATYLVNKGIDENRIVYKGYGKRKAIASNLTKEGRKKNQRVELKILSIGNG